MGTLLNRRRYMGGKGRSCPYITDGLVFWLDGLQGVGTDSWTDLIGGVVFTSNNITKTTYGVEISSKGAKTDSDLTFPDTYSLEIVCMSPPRTTGKQVFYCGKNNTVSFQFYQGMCITKIPQGAKYSYPIDSERHCFTVVPNGFYIDSSPLTTGSTDTIAIRGTGTCVCAKYNGETPYDREVDCIRIYNRTLTSAEVLYNARIDNERFNLGLTI